MGLMAEYLSRRSIGGLQVPNPLSNMPLTSTPSFGHSLHVRQVYPEGPGLDVIDADPITPSSLSHSPFPGATQLPPIASGFGVATGHRKREREREREGEERP